MNALSLSIRSAGPTLVVALLLVAATACTSQPTAEAVSKFSVALDGASTSVIAGLKAVQALETRVNDTAVAEDFVRDLKSNIRLDNSNVGLTDKVVAPRLAFFEALSEYASSLAAASSDAQIETVRAKFTAVGTAFNGLGASIADAKGITFPANYAARAADAFGKLAAFLVDARLNREIPDIVKSTHAQLVVGVEAFKHDLGDPEDGGFRAIVNDSIEILVGQRKTLLLEMRNEGLTPKAALYQAVLDAQADVRALRQTDRLLSAIPRALDKMLEAHEALMTPKDATTLGRIEIFFERARQLYSIASSLKS